MSLVENMYKKVSTIGYTTRNKLKRLECDGKTVLVSLYSGSWPYLVHNHTLRVPVVAEPNNNHSFFFVHYGLVHLPAVREML